MEIQKYRIASFVLALLLVSCTNPAFAGRSYTVDHRSIASFCGDGFTGDILVNSVDGVKSSESISIDFMAWHSSRDFTDPIKADKAAYEITKCIYGCPEVAYLKQVLDQRTIRERLQDKAGGSKKNSMVISVDEDDYQESVQQNGMASWQFYNLDLGSVYVKNYGSLFAATAGELCIGSNSNVFGENEIRLVRLCGARHGIFLDSVPYDDLKDYLENESSTNNIVAIHLSDFPTLDPNVIVWSEDGYSILETKHQDGSRVWHFRISEKEKLDDGLERTAAIARFQEISGIGMSSLKELQMDRYISDCVGNIGVYEQLIAAGDYDKTYETIYYEMLLGYSSFEIETS